jgi:hypothetical protein
MAIRMSWQAGICITLGALLLMVTGCASPMTTIAKTPPARYEVLGKATGKAKGTMLLFDGLLTWMPVMLNTRVERAYNQALCSVPGATGLINVTLQENWCWWLIGSTRAVTITGDAIKETK